MLRIISMLVCLAVLSGCATKSDIASSLPPVDSGVITIGAVLPLSGDYSIFGRQIKDGLDLKIAEANAGAAKKLRLVTVDNQSTAAGSLEGFRALVKKYHPPVIIGAYTSTNTMAMKYEAMQLETTLITPTATNDLITERNPYVFRSCFCDSRQGSALGKFAYESGLKRIGVMLDVDEDGMYSKMLGRSVGEAFENAGGKVVIEEGYYSAEADFSRQLESIKKRKVDAILLPGYPDDVIRMILNGRGIGFTKVFFGGDGWNNAALPRLLKRQLVGCFFSTMYAPDYPAPQVKKFISAYTAAYKVDPDMPAAQGYDTAGIVVAALGGGDADANTFRKNLYTIKNYPGVTGNISFDAQGNAVKPVFIREFVPDDKDGVLLKLKKIMTP